MQFYIINLAISQIFYFLYLNMFKEFWQASKRQTKRLKNTFSHPYWDRVRLKEFKRRWDTHKLGSIESWIHEVFREGWIRPLGNEPSQLKSAFSWPFYSDPIYNRELTKFMFSFRDEASTNRNINSLMFITGPELSGKSWLLKHNLEKFQSAKVTKLHFHIDLNNFGSLNLESFLDIFEGEIISTLVERCQDKFQDKSILTPTLIMDLLIFTHDRLYLDIKLSELIEKSLKLNDLLLITESQRQKLLEFRGKALTNSEASTPYVDNFLELCKILSENIPFNTEHKRTVQAALLLGKNLYIQEELASCPEKVFSGLYRTGIKTTWFLLNVLNLIGGFHEMNLKNLEYPHVLIVLGNNLYRSCTQTIRNRNKWR